MATALAATLDGSAASDAAGPGADPLAREKREIFLSYGHGGYTQLVRMVAQGLLEQGEPQISGVVPQCLLGSRWNAAVCAGNNVRAELPWPALAGHTVWFDELALEVGNVWADKMSQGLRDGAGSGNKLVIFFLDYYGCRRGVDKMPHAPGNGFCVNEMAIATGADAPLLVVTLTDAHPPASLCFDDVLSLDVRDVLGDRELRLGDVAEDKAPRVITDAQAAPDEALFKQCDLGSVPDLSGVDDFSAAMSAYFMHRPGVISTVRRIIDLAGQPNPARGLEEAAKQLGAATTLVRNVGHWKRGTSERAKSSPRMRIFVAGEEGTMPLLTRLRGALVAQGHELKVMHCDVVGDHQLDSAESAEHGINWAVGSPSDCPGLLLLLLTDGFAKPSGEIIACAMNSYLSIAPLRVSTTCPLPITVVTTQYHDFAPVVSGSIEEGSFEVHEGFDHFADLLCTSLDEGLECFDQANAARRRVEKLFQPQDNAAELGRHDLFCGRVSLKQEIEDWRRSPTSKAVRVYEGCLWCGKTALAAHLARTCPTVWALHITANGSELRGMILNLAFQIASRLPKGPAAFVFAADGSVRRYRTSLRPTGAGDPEPARTADLSGLLSQADIPTLVEELFKGCLAPLLAALPKRLRSVGPVLMEVDGIDQIRVDGKANPAMVLSSLSSAAECLSSDELQVRVLAFADAGSISLGSASAAAAASEATAPPAAAAAAATSAATPARSVGSASNCLPKGASVEILDMIGEPGSARRDEMVQDMRSAVSQRMKAAAVGRDAEPASTWGGNGSALDDVSARICDLVELDFAWATELAQHMAASRRLGELPELERPHKRRHALMVRLLAEAGLEAAGQALIAAVLHKPDDAALDVLVGGLLSDIMPSSDGPRLAHALSPMFKLQGPQQHVKPVAGERQLVWLRTMSKYDSEGRRLWEAWYARVLQVAQASCSGPHESDRDAVRKAAQAQIGGSLALRLAGEQVERAGWNSLGFVLSRAQKFAVLVSSMRRRFDTSKIYFGKLSRGEAEARLQRMGASQFLLRTNRDGGIVVSSNPGGTRFDHRIIYALGAGKYSTKEAGGPEFTFDDLHALLTFAQLDGTLPDQLAAKPSA